MATFRVYFAERMPRGAQDWMRTSGLHRAGSQLDELTPSETRWEEEVESRDAAAALSAFFREHVAGSDQVMWVDESGESRPVEGLDYDPEKTYIWIENDKLMEYEGMDEATPGMVACPLCGGEGEVDEALAEEFLADQQDDDDGVTWG
jgi:hypothetical protein